MVIISTRNVVDGSGAVVVVGSGVVVEGSSIVLFVGDETLEVVVEDLDLWWWFVLEW